MRQNTQIQPTLPEKRRLLLPQAPVLVLDGHKLHALTTDGEFVALTVAEARRIAQAEVPMVCHAPLLARHLGLKHLAAYDLLELFAFVHPGVFCVPTPAGLARALHLLDPVSPEDQCTALRDVARHLLVDLSAPAREDRSDAAALAAMMGLLPRPENAATAEGVEGWLWTPVVLAALGRLETPPARGEIRAALRIWDRLPEWAVHAPPPPASHLPVGGDEAAERLRRMLSCQKKEDRPEQEAYARALTEAFAPVDAEGQTRVVLAEAGTGVGKTLGYLAPATLWAEKNGAPVWVSTYTRNLQRQVATELEKLYADPQESQRKAVTRKGRENYLCLLNLEDAVQSSAAAANAQNAVALGLMLRWSAVTADGDLAGRDFPGWLAGLMGPARVAALADRRGECVYSACPHFDRCFIEKSIRKSKRADIVIANHALVMHQTDSFDGGLPPRLVFDEGHHLFDAADGAFRAELTGRETADLRRWILGAETAAGQRSRARGLKRRLEGLVTDEEELRDIDAVIEAARGLPGQGWRQRLLEGAPKGTTENFLALCRRQVMARNSETGGFYSLEADALPPVPELFEAAVALLTRLRDLRRPMLALAAGLRRKLSDEADALDTDGRTRIGALAHGLEWRAEAFVGNWVSMLESLRTQETPAGCVDWMEITRIEGREDDAGFFRAAVDPAAVFADLLKPTVQGVVVTSATLRDATEEDAEGWKSPRVRTGAARLDAEGSHTHTFAAASPFDYAAQTRVLVVRDVRKDSADEVAAAFRELFLAAGGGALGIFTAVQRLKAVQERIVARIEERGLRLYAQHVDPLDISTLIDIFREEQNACLLGTDATRDGIDVPGRSLRLVVYDRVPWPRPTLLHKARRAHFGKGYDDMQARFRLKQAFGRLIRRKDDRGVFVMLDSAMPSRLCTAFPEGVAIERIGLKDALDITRSFLSDNSTH